MGPAENMLPWSAPELLRPEERGRRHATRASDVWSFATTAWEILLGREPYAIEPKLGASRCSERILSGASPQEVAGTRWPKDISSELTAVLESCWKMQPSERPDMRHISRILVRAMPYAVSASQRFISAVPRAALAASASVPYRHDTVTSGPRHVWTSAKVGDDNGVLNALRNNGSTEEMWGDGLDKVNMLSGGRTEPHIYHLPVV